MEPIDIFTTLRNIEARLTRLEQIVCPSPEVNGNGEHAAFIKGWVEAFKAFHGFDYVFGSGRDAKAVRELLKMGITRLDLLELAKSAWSRAKGDERAWNCRQASTIFGFASHINQIRTELQGGNGNGKTRSPWELKTLLDVKKTIATRLKNDHSYEMALGTSWNDEGKRDEYQQIVREVKALESQLSRMI